MITSVGQQLVTPVRLKRDAGISPPRWGITLNLSWFVPSGSGIGRLVKPRANWLGVPCFDTVRVCFWLTLFSFRISVLSHWLLAASLRQVFLGSDQAYRIFCICLNHEICNLYLSFSSHIHFTQVSVIFSTASRLGSDRSSLSSVWSIFAQLMTREWYRRIRGSF